MYSINYIKSVLMSNGLAPSKARGINFLYDRGMLKALVSSLGIERETPVVEIGPGLGHLTSILLEYGACVTAIELDAGFVRHLSNLVVNGVHPQIIHSNATAVDFRALRSASQARLVVAGNLPYAAASAILFHLLRFPDVIDRMGLMVQLEFAQRMCSPAGSRTYGRLSVMVQCRWKTTIARQVPPDVFYPRPKVTSAFVLLSPLTYEPVTDDLTLEHLVRAAFSRRRKTLLNAVEPYFASLGLGKDQAEATMGQAGISPTARAEQISPGQYAIWASAVRTLHQ